MARKPKRGEPHPYRPMTPSDYRSVAEPQRFDHLVRHVTEQAHVIWDEPPGERVRRVSMFPREVQTLYWGWRFSCEVAGNGMIYFLLNPLGVYVPEIHAALKSLKADELVERLEAGLPLVMEDAAFVYQRPDAFEWAKQFPRNPKYPTSAEVDAGLYRTLMPAFHELLRTFLTRNEKAFVH